MHGLSVEPLVGPIPTLRLAKIHWVILGGESGPKARPMQYRWAADIRDQCIAAEVPFFFKQWGKLASDPDPSDPTAKRNGGKAKGGRMLDGRTWDGMPLRRPAGVGGLVDGNEAKRERRVAQHASVEMDTP